METAVCIGYGVRPDWMFSVVSACQKLAGDTFDTSPHGFTQALTRFQGSLPSPERPIEMMLLRDRIIESTTKAAELFDWCFHRRFSESPCRREPVNRAADTWRSGCQDVRGLLPKWTDVFLSEFDQSHRWPLAERIAEALRDRSAHPVTIDGLAREFGCARTRITREFRREFGMTVATYHTRVRIQQAVRALRMSTYSVEAVARTIGYRSPKNFYAALQSLAGLSPSAVRALPHSDFEALLDRVLPRRAHEMPQPTSGGLN